MKKVFLITNLLMICFCCISCANNTEKLKTIEVPIIFSEEEIASAKECVEEWFKEYDVGYEMDHFYYDEKATANYFYDRDETMINRKSAIRLCTVFTTDSSLPENGKYYPFEPNTHYEILWTLIKRNDPSSEWEIWDWGSR